MTEALRSRAVNTGSSGKAQILIFLVVLVASWAQNTAAKEIANVNGRPVTEKDMEAALGTLNEGQRESVLSDPGARRQVLLNVVDQELLAQEAEKQKLDQDAEFKDAMTAFRKQYLANRLLNKVLKPKVTDDAARKYYKAHLVKFNTDVIQVFHILNKDEKTAREVLAKAKKPGADFQKLAETLSIDPKAKDNRGDLGYIGRNQLVAEFTDPVFEAEKGSVIGPVRTAFGYHVIKVGERKIGKTLDYNEIELTVKAALQKDLLQSYAAGLRAGAKIKINE